MPNQTFGDDILVTTPGSYIAPGQDIVRAGPNGLLETPVAPGDDAEVAEDALVRHLESHAPFGAQVTVTRGETGQPGIIGFDGPSCDAAFDAFRTAWGKEPVFIGCGGSIPMVADFQQAFPEATVLVTAVADPDSRPHGIDESQHLGDLEKACLAETLLLARLAR